MRFKSDIVLMVGRCMCRCCSVKRRMVNENFSGSNGGQSSWSWKARGPRYLICVMTKNIIYPYLILITLPQNAIHPSIIIITMQQNMIYPNITKGGMSAKTVLGSGILGAKVCLNLFTSRKKVPNSHHCQ